MYAKARSVGVIFVLMLLLSPIMYVFSAPTKSLDIKTIERSQETYNPTFDQKLESTTTFEYNAEVRDSYMYGSIRVCRDAKVLMDNVTFFVSEMKIYLEDNAKLIIRNSKFISESGSPYMYVETYNSSELVIEDTNIMISSISVYVYDSSKIKLNNTGNITNFYAYDESNITLTGIITSLCISLHDQSSLLIYNAQLTDSPWVYLNDDSNAVIRDSNYNGSVSMFHGSELLGYDSYIDRINAYNETDIILNNCSGFYIDVRGDVFLSMYNCDYDTAELKVYETSPKRMLKGGPKGIINNTTIDSLTVYSFLVTKIINSTINSLYFVDVYTGYLHANSSGRFYDKHYSDCEIIDSTITVSYNYTYSYIFVANATEVMIENVSLYRLYMYNVSKAEIWYMDYLSIYSWYTDLTIYDSVMTSISVTSYDGIINVTNIISSSWFEIDVSNAELYVKNINGVGVSTAYIDISKSYADLHNVTVDRVGLDIWQSEVNIDLFSFAFASTTYIDYSSVHLKDGFIDSTAYVDYSTVYLSNTTMNYVYVNEYWVEDGNFVLNNSMISSYTGTVLYGIVDQGSSSVGYISVGYLYAYNAIINAYGLVSRSGIYSPDFYVYLYDESEFVGHDVYTLGFGMEIYIYNGSNLYLYGGQIEEIYGFDGFIWLNDTNVSETLAIYNADLNASYSFFDKIDIYNSTNIWINNCNISSGMNIDIEYIFEYMFAGYEVFIPTVDVTVINSNASDITMIAYGSINVTNSEVENLFYVFQSVYLKDTNVTGILLNNTLFTEGNVVIDHNMITLGSGINLLSVSGDCNINQVYGAIVVDADTSNVDLSVSNSTYFGLVTKGGHISIDSSYITMIMSLNSSSIYMHNVTMDASMLGEAVSLILAGNVNVENTTIAIAGLVFSGNNVLLRDINANISMLFLLSDNATIENYDSITMDFYVGIYNSSAHIKNSNMGFADITGSNVVISQAEIVAIDVEGSSCSIEKSTIYGDTIVIQSDSVVNINESDIDAIVLYKYYYTARNITLDVENSNITDRYVIYYNITTYKGVTLNNETIMGEYDTTTSYGNVNKNSAERHIVFEVNGYGKAIIANYTGYSIIDMLWVNTTKDTNPPIIESLNGTEVKYELGYNASIYVELNDETPTKYEVYLDGSIIMEDTYSAMQTVSIAITDYTTTARTYVLKIDAYDSEGLKATLQILIKVYAAEPPEITSKPQDNYTINRGDTLNLEWVAIDAMPNTYSIYINGESVTTDTWTNGSTVTYSFVGSEVGTFNITIIFYDKLGQHTADTVIITVKEATTPTQDYVWILIIAVIIVVVAVILFAKKKKK